MALPAIAPTGQVDLPVGTATANVQIPSAGTPTQVLVTNLGMQAAYVLLGNNTVAVTTDTGTPIMPGDKLALTLGANTYIAGITQGGNSVLRVTAGT